MSKHAAATDWSALISTHRSTTSTRAARANLGAKVETMAHEVIPLRDIGGRRDALVARPLAVTSPLKIQVMIVEDDPAFMQRFSHIVTSDDRFELKGAYRNGSEALRGLQDTAPDMLLVDLGLPDISGIEVIRAATKANRTIDIMVVTVFGDEEHVLASIEAGATGYLLKDSLPEEFIEVMLQLRDGGSPISPVIARRLLTRLRPSMIEPSASVLPRSLLSGRETEILSLLAKGFSFGEIAILLGISAHTVTAHVKKIYQKLAVHSRGEAVYEASRMGLIS